jgi:hypothetical protein
MDTIVDRVPANMSPAAENSSTELLLNYWLNLPAGEHTVRCSFGLAEKPVASTDIRIKVEIVSSEAIIDFFKTSATRLKGLREAEERIVIEDGLKKVYQNSLEFGVSRQKFKTILMEEKFRFLSGNSSPCSLFKRLDIPEGARFD